ncbi:transcription factor S [archaeon]|jgi:transcription factor S|nr:transcription factor S [archaeon]MBT4241904.1 transcription factor S [archaeon]MBT4418451.1 transcription factor S [archaeon]
MEFCPKCGCVLVEKKKNEFKCPRCNHKSKTKIKIESSEKIEVKPEIGVITNEDTDVFPKISAVCQKCNHKEAYFWTSQTRSADEAETKFFRCTKCKHTWRQYH